MLTDEQLTSITKVCVCVCLRVSSHWSLLLRTFTEIFKNKMFYHNESHNN